MTRSDNALLLLWVVLLLAGFAWLSAEIVANHRTRVAARQHLIACQQQGADPDGCCRTVGGATCALTKAVSEGAR